MPLTVRTLEEMGEQGVARATAARLHEAMLRLVNGDYDPSLSDGRLTVVNLALQAGVSRATANRAGQIIKEFGRIAELVEEGAIEAADPTLRVAQLKNEMIRLRRAHREREEALQQSIDILAQRVQFLELRCQLLEQRATPETPIIPIGSRR